MGSIGSIGGSSGKSKAKDITAPEFSALRDPFAQQIEGQLPQLQGITADTPTLGDGLDPNQFVQPISAQEQGIVNQIANAQLAGGSPEALAAQDLRTRTIQGEFLQPDQATLDALNRPVVRAFEEARRGDVGAFTRAGQNIQESSPFFRARGIAQEGLAGALANTNAQLFLNERGIQAQTAQEATAQDAQRVQTAVQSLQATALPRLVQDLGIERGLQAFDARRDALLAFFQGVAGVTDESIGQKSSQFGLNAALG
jgi:hypothetical protein